MRRRSATPFCMSWLPADRDEKTEERQGGDAGFESVGNLRGKEENAAVRIYHRELRGSGGKSGGKKKKK